MSKKTGLSSYFKKNKMILLLIVILVIALGIFIPLLIWIQRPQPAELMFDTTRGAAPPYNGHAGTGLAQSFTATDDSISSFTIFTFQPSGFEIPETITIELLKPKNNSDGVSFNYPEDFQIIARGQISYLDFVKEPLSSQENPNNLTIGFSQNLIVGDKYILLFLADQISTSGSFEYLGLSKMSYNSYAGGKFYIMNELQSVMKPYEEWAGTATGLDLSILVYS